MPFQESITSNLADIKRELHELPDKLVVRYARKAMQDVAGLVLAEAQRRVDALPFPYSEGKTRSELQIVKAKPKNKDPMYMIKAPWYIRLYEGGFVHNKTGKFIKKEAWFTPLTHDLQGAMEEIFTATVERLSTKYWRRKNR